MALQPGTRFGPYEITEEIGAGGMGVVYRATDTNLKRDVAVKVLPESFATDEERLTRFQREAELLASLNHPNIAQIYGLEESEGTTALIMELVEGPTLAERIEQGAIPADEALGIAMQIVEALKGAHGQGIVHRDLKPANIKLRNDRVVKVLDFGIAKALEPESLTTEPQSPMLTTPATQVGVILGTAAYMSPEQARGLQVDQRADIWAFGCVLYEMLTGQPAFGGEDVTITLARIAIDDTDFDSLPAGISPAVRHAIKLCLEKDVDKRLHAIGDVRLALEGAFETVSPRAAEAAEITVPPWRRTGPVAAGALLAGAIVVGLTAWSLWPGPESRPLYRFDYELPQGESFVGTGRPLLAISPDGGRFLYNTAGGIRLREMDQLEARLIPGTEEGTRSPVFSPDGESIVYYHNGIDQLLRIAVSGGAPVKLADVPSNVFGLSWEADGTILYGQPEGIYRVPATGGTPELVVEAEQGTRIYGARMLPDGDSLLFSTGPAGDWDGAQVVAQSLSTGERTVLVNGGNDARYVPTGHIVYTLGDGLFAVDFDLDSLSVSGGAVPLVQGVMRAAANITAAANFGIADNGTLVYIAGDATEGVRSLAWVDRDGNQELLNVPQRTYLWAQLSPDGTRVAVSDFDNEQDVWIWNLGRETFQRLTFDAEFNGAPIWSPDSQRIAFSRLIGDGDQEIFWQAADGTGSPEALTEDSPVDMFPTDFTPDGSALIYMTAGGTASDIWMVPVEGPPTAGVPLVATPADERSGAVSPDGRWLAYQSNESGEHQVYVRPFPDVDSGLWQVSTGGGASPLWSPDGTELFYFINAPGPEDAVMAVSVESSDALTLGAPRALFRGDFLPPASRGAFFDVSQDGQRFLMITTIASRPSEDAARIIVVQNWLEELNRLAPPLE